MKKTELIIKIILVIVIIKTTALEIMNMIIPTKNKRFNY